jgi:hypothetical protein
MIDKATMEWFRQQGRIGGKSTLKKYGTEHFKNLRKKHKKLSPVESEGVVDKKTD